MVGEAQDPCWLWSRPRSKHMAGLGFVWPLTGRGPQEIMNCYNSKRHSKPVANQKAQIRVRFCMHSGTSKGPVDGWISVCYLSAAGHLKGRQGGHERLGNRGLGFPLDAHQTYQTTGRRLGRLVGRSQLTNELALFTHGRARSGCMGRVTQAHTRTHARTQRTHACMSTGKGWCGQRMKAGKAPK